MRIGDSLFPDAERGGDLLMTAPNLENEYRAAESLLQPWDAVTEPELSWGILALFMSLIVFATLCFCGGAMLAAAWCAYDDIPAAGVMDGGQ